MSTRSSIFALAAVAAFGATALTSTNASAKPVMGVVVKHPIQGIVINQPHPILGVIAHPPHPIMGVAVNHPNPVVGVVVKPPHPIMGIVIKDPDHDHDHDHDHDRDHDHDWGHRMIWLHHQYAPVDEDQTVHVTSPVATVPTAPCNCLTKKYLEDGSVLFKDVCTKEAAMATPDELRAQMQGVGPEPH